MKTSARSITQLAKMQIDPNFIEVTADVCMKICLIKYDRALDCIFLRCYETQRGQSNSGRVSFCACGVFLNVVLVAFNRNRNIVLTSEKRRSGGYGLLVPCSVAPVFLPCPARTVFFSSSQTSSVHDEGLLEITKWQLTNVPVSCIHQPMTGVPGTR